MNIKRVLGAFAAGLVAAGTFTAQSANRYWVGPEGGKWSIIENWDDGIKPTAADTLSLNKDDTYVIDLDETSTAEAPLLGGLNGGENNKTTFFNSDTSVTNMMYLASGVSSTFGKGSVVTVKGQNTQMVLQGQATFVDGSKIVSADGAFVNVVKAKFDGTGNGNATFESKGNNSGMDITIANTSALTYPAKTLSFNIEDGGWIYVNNNASGKGITFNSGSSKLNVKMDRGYSSQAGITVNQALVNLDLLDSELKFSSFTAKGANGSSIKLNNSVLKTNWGISFGDGYDATALICGANPYMRLSGGGGKIGAKAVVTLIPELSWDEKSATSGEGKFPLFYGSNTGSSAKVYLTSGWQCIVDVSKFAHFYGTKKIQFAYTASTAAHQFCKPAVTVIGEGAENCTVTFDWDAGKKDTTTSSLWMTITAENPAEDEVAGIKKDGHMVYYKTLAAAFAAAEADETIKLVSNVALPDAVAVNKAVTLDVGAFTVTTNETFAAASLFSVTDGALTVVGTGTIDGGTNAAVTVTGGAFATLPATAVTFASTSGAVVVSAETAAEILGGTFVSAEGDPVVSEVGGILKGGAYNKEPAAALVAEGYKTEQVGDMWEVVLDGTPICQYGSDATGYRLSPSLQKAYEMVPDGGAIVIVADATVPALTMDRNITVYFDLKGYTLTPEEAGALFTVKAGKVRLWNNPGGETTGALKGGVVVDDGDVQITMPIDADPALTVNGGDVAAINAMYGSVVVNGGYLRMQNYGDQKMVVDAPGVAIQANGGQIEITGGSFTGGTAAFEAGSSYTYKGIDDGSFSSEIPAQYLKKNRLMKQVGDRWVVELASDEANVTYTWKGALDGDWADKANWTPNIARCFGIPSNNYATASFPALSGSKAYETITVNLGGEYSQLKQISYNHNGRLALTNGVFKLQSGALSGDRRLVLKDAVVTVADPVYANAQNFNFQLNGNAKVIGDVAPNNSTKALGRYDESYNSILSIGSNEVTGVIHNRNTQLNVLVLEDATLVAGEIKADSNTTYLRNTITIAKGGKLIVRDLKKADIAAGFSFTFNVPATGLASAPLSFLKNDENVDLTEYTALTVNIDEGFVGGRIPLISGTWLSDNDIKKIMAGGNYGPLVVNGTFPKGTKFALESKNGVISLVVSPCSMLFYVK